MSIGVTGYHAFRGLARSFSLPSRSCASSGLIQFGIPSHALPPPSSFSLSHAVIDRFNLHGYQGTAGNRSGVYEEVRVRGGKTIRMSEHGESDNTGATLATTLALDLTFLHPQRCVRDAANSAQSELGLQSSM